MKNKVLTFLIIGDLHGEKPILHVDLKGVDAIICPGDICGDDIRPYIKKLIEMRTIYDEDYDFEKICPKWKQKYLDFKSLRRGRKILKYLNSFGKPVFIVPGNWDQTPYLDGKEVEVNGAGVNKKNNWEKIKKGLVNIRDVENKKINFRGVTFIGHGSVSAPEVLKKPIKKDFECAESFELSLVRYKFFKKVYSKLKRYFKSAKYPIIHLSHNAVYKTKLDKIYAPNTYAHNKHYGSIIARKLVDEFSPMLSVGGHIHEGYGKTRIRKTVCLNAGFGGDVNTIVKVDVEKGKVLSVEFLGENKEN